MRLKILSCYYGQCFERRRASLHSPASGGRRKEGENILEGLGASTVACMCVCVCLCVWLSCDANRFLLFLLSLSLILPSVVTSFEIFLCSFFLFSTHSSSH